MSKKKIIIITLNITNRYCSKIYMITYCTSASTVLIVYESNVLLILSYTFTSKFNTSRFSYSYLVRVLHTKAHITQGNKNMYQKKSHAAVNKLSQSYDGIGCYTWLLNPSSFLPLTFLISLDSHPLCLCNHAELPLASRADQHNRTSL